VAKSRKPSNGEPAKASGKKVAVRPPEVKPEVKNPAKPLRKTTLSKKELDEFREILMAKRRSLLGDMSGMSWSGDQASSGNLSTMPTHMADVGTDNFEHEFTLGLLESEQALLTEINQALQRIDERTYGICLGTGEPIPKARLKAKPWAKYTVEYARMLEKGLAHAPDEEGEAHPAAGGEDEDAEEEHEPEEEEDFTPEEVEREEEE
jgi:RNA polymerase-binding protein DksA